ncbi:MAG: epoxyqueuosine reductase QueH [Elusimicrobiota bacterium]
MNKILIHHCCAPCSYGIVGALEKEYEIEGYWFNPNIHPEEEHAKRRDALRKYTESRGITLHEKKDFIYRQDEWVMNAPKEPTERCEYCYYLRLNDTAYAARKADIGVFTTSLLSSPYQKHELVKQAGKRVASAYGIEFLYRDFRQFYYEGKNSARQEGVHMQKYCGCVFSVDEKRAPEKAALK